MEVVVFNEKIYHFSTTLETTLADVTYSCGALLDELNLPPGLESVCIRDHQCGDTTEKLYYFAWFDPVCYYCGSEEVDTSIPENIYPLRPSCVDKEHVYKRNK